MYVQLMIQTLTGWRPSDEATMWITGGGFVFGLVMGVGMAVRDKKAMRDTR
ncbi:MAG: hypothetical protein HZC36_10820 [Armatimonadetes bacterium]|nr:hypothetical protein [Armatimonadota bacterium]